ncbi:MAG: flagellar M-ring protein FliF C-terminal domain-containing protein [Planctomycetaceae bacterium]
MNFFQQAIAPLRESFLAMPMQSRVIAGMLVATIALGLGLLVRGTGGTNDEYLFGGRTLGENEVDSVELAFSQAGLSGWTREGRRIKIPRETRSEYLSALQASSSLPMELRSSMQEAIDQSTPFESSEQRLSREMHAKEQDLGRKIMAFPDIRYASVEYDRGERFGMSRQRSQSASVLVSPEGTEPLSKARENMIKDLIRGSFAGMNAEDVVVTDTNSTHSNSPLEGEDPLLRKRLEEEASYEQKILKTLVGYGPNRVAAHAEIDPTMGVEKTSLKYDGERTTLSEYSKKVDSESARPAQGGVPGVVPNAIGNRATSLESMESIQKSKADEREASGVVGQEYEQSRMASFQVRRVRVSVGIPSSYYDQVLLQDFLRENPGKSAVDAVKPTAAQLQAKKDETQQRIQAAVTPLLPVLPVGEDPFPLVQVWDYPDLPALVTDTAGPADVALSWLADSWQTLAMLGLAVLAVLIARSALTGMSSGPTPGFNEGFGLELPAPPVVDETDKKTIDQPEGMQITGGSLKEELVRLVESNPDVAANVLRSWISDAA